MDSRMQCLSSFIDITGTIKNIFNEFYSIFHLCNLKNMTGVWGHILMGTFVQIRSKSGQSEAFSGFNSFTAEAQRMLICFLICVTDEGDSSRQKQNLLIQHFIFSLRHQNISNIKKLQPVKDRDFGFPKDV